MDVKYDHSGHNHLKSAISNLRFSVSCVLCFLCVQISSPTFLRAIDIEGVQPAALDQPRVHIHVRRDPKGPALSTGKGEEQTINIQAFLDTGASGIMLSTTSADALKIK